MTIYRVTFSPSRQVHIDVDAANPAAAIEEARLLWNANASNPQFSVSEGPHDAAFGTANVRPLQRRYEVQIVETITHVGTVYADSEDEAIATAEDAFDAFPGDFAQLTDHEISEITVLSSAEA
jgi:hypothetical protein